MLVPSRASRASHTPLKYRHITSIVLTWNDDRFSELLNRYHITSRMIVICAAHPLSQLILAQTTNAEHLVLYSHVKAYLFSSQNWIYSIKFLSHCPDPVSKQNQYCAILNMFIWTQAIGNFGTRSEIINLFWATFRYAYAVKSSAMLFSVF